MSSPGWARVKQALAEVLSVAPAEREQAIDAACAGDQDLRREVEEYLRYERRAEVLLAAPAAGESLPAEQPAPERVGPWRILRESGRGGMGVVYLAERDDGEYRQLAALKLVRDRRGSAVFVDLLRRERQILAQLEHPNIARLLDGGTTPAGQPYYAMEYVEGEPLAEYCRRRNLSMPQRLRLFLKVCDAVNYAHRRLIIHRDLKPGNILVNAEGEPKLLDFGLAKVLDPTVEGELTVSGTPLLTPTYASPEQLRGEHLTTATDVYSLGVILYELISGRLPYDKPGQTLFRLWTAVCEETPAPPGVTTDLDSIVLMALRNQPEQRYSSVDAFVADVERYLDGRPVRAHQGNVLYRFRRFVVRHKWAVSTAAAVFVATCLALGFIWRAERRAELRFLQLRQLARSVVFELHDSIAELPGSTAARKLLVERSLEYLRSLEASRGHDAKLKWELAEAYKRIGDAQGNPAIPNLGDSAGAADSYAHARRLLHEIIAENSADSLARSTLANLDRTYADILWDHGRKSESLAVQREALETLKQAAERDPKPAARKSLALAQWGLAVSLTQAQDWPAAAQAWQQTLALYESLAREPDAGITARRNVALSDKRLAAVYMQQHRFQEAIERLGAAERIDRARLAAEPLSPQAKMDLSFDLSDLSLALTTIGRTEEGVARCAEALALRRQVAQADPHDYRARFTVGRSLNRLAAAYQSAGNPGAAIRSAREGVEIMSAVCTHDPANQQVRKETALAYTELGRLYRAQSDWKRAESAYRRALALLLELKAGTSLTDEDRQRMAAIPPAIEECRRNLSLRP